MDDSKTNNISIKWLKFLINWRIPIGLILNALSLNTLIHNMPPKDLFSIAFESFYFLIAIILPMLTFFYCIKYKELGYYLLKCSLIIEIVFNSAINSLNTISPYTENPLSSFLIPFISVVIISSLAWIYPNFIYLKNRKHLFVSKEKNTEKQNEKDTTNKKTDNSENNIEYIKKEKSLNNDAKKDEFTFSISKKNLKIIILSLITIILISIGIYFLVDYIGSLKDEILNYKRKYNTVNNKYTSLQRDYTNMETKVNFYDENIVFVLEGYGNYYYTYDQVEQITQGKSYSYWAYNKSAAIGEGYKEFQSESSWEEYKKTHKLD